MCAAAYAEVRDIYGDRAGRRDSREANRRVEALRGPEIVAARTVLLEAHRESWAQYRQDVEAVYHGEAA